LIHKRNCSEFFKINIHKEYLGAKSLAGFNTAPQLLPKLTLIAKTNNETANGIYPDLIFMFFLSVIAKINMESIILPITVSKNA